MLIAALSAQIRRTSASRKPGLSQILSEAGIGKAYLKEMGIQPWRAVQPDFPDAMIGIIMSSYYGGRSEIHLRRVITQVLYCDFLSMYPTVCTLMGLWRFVIAKGMTSRDSTRETAEFLAGVALEDLRRPDTWQRASHLGPGRTRSRHLSGARQICGRISSDHRRKLSHLKTAAMVYACRLHCGEASRRKGAKNRPGRHLRARRDARRLAARRYRGQRGVYDRSRIAMIFTGA